MSTPRDEHENTGPIPVKEGILLDRDGNVLARPEHEPHESFNGGFAGAGGPHIRVFRLGGGGGLFGFLFLAIVIPILLVTGFVAVTGVVIVISAIVLLSRLFRMITGGAR